MSDGQEDETEPYLESVIDDAIGPNAALLPTEVRLLLRRALRDAAKDDPELAALYKGARPRAAPATTGPTPSDPQTVSTPGGRTPLPLRRNGGAA